MNEYLTQENLTLFASLVALIISVLSWKKSRVIYQFESLTIRQIRGRSDDAAHDKSVARLNKRLKSGSFTILNIATREADGDFQVFLGKVKK